MSGWIAGATIVGAVGGSLISAQGAKKSAKSQAAAQLQANADTNEANYKMFKEARGSGGHAILPEYFGGFEKDFSGDIIDIYKDSKGTYSPAFGNATLDRMKPSWERGDEFIGDVFSGKFTDERRRLAGESDKATKQAINTGLGERLAQIKMNRSRRGLGGESSFTNSLSQGATIDARTLAALQRITADQQILDQDIGLRSQFLDAPVNRSRLAYEFGYMPERENYRVVDDMLQRLGYFNIGQGNPPMQQTPNIPTIPNSAQAWGAGLSSGANALGNYWMAKQFSQPTQPTQPTSPAGQPYVSLSGASGGGQLLPSNSIAYNPNAFLIPPAN
jgi:hypothetical protein